YSKSLRHGDSFQKHDHFGVHHRIVDHFGAAARAHASKMEYPPRYRPQDTVDCIDIRVFRSDEKGCLPGHHGLQAPDYAGVDESNANGAALAIQLARHL